MDPEEIKGELLGLGKDFIIPAQLKFVDESGQDLTGDKLYE